MKRALMIASMASMLDNFNSRNIEILREKGYALTVAANFLSEDSNSPERVAEFRARMEAEGVQVEQVDFSRRIGNLSGQLKSYRQVKALAAQGFDLVHCHSPICAAMTRMAFRSSRRKRGTSVIYTAHGFHFFDGAPKVNWLIYYPIERLCSRYTDLQITINREDYDRANEKLHAVKTAWIPGVGVNPAAYVPAPEKAAAVRAEFGIPADAMLLLSVGELNANKNHRAVIEALSRARRKDVYYIVAGQGDIREDLLALAREKGVADRVFLPGFRRDIADLCAAADAFAFPSMREGLSVALLEAMSAGLWCYVSGIRGNRDLIRSGSNGMVFPTADYLQQLAAALDSVEDPAALRAKAAEFNGPILREYSAEHVDECMKELYAQYD